MLLVDLALVLQHIRQGQAHPQARGNTITPNSSSSGGSGMGSGSRVDGPSHGDIATKASRLLAFACDQGWVAVAGAVLPLVNACGHCAEDIVWSAHAATAQVRGIREPHEKD
jgi:hypothetical protein